MNNTYAMNALDSADFTRTAKFGKTEPMVECTACDGYGFTEADESGRPYTCYRCCETGWITKSSADAEALAAAAYREEEEAKALATRKLLGVPDGYGYYIDQVDGEVILVPPRPAPGAPLPVVNYDDDIPF